MVALAFYLFSSLLLFSGWMVITARNPVHSVLFLIFAFFNAAGLFVILGAEFLAMLLVIVYVGAVAVLFLFVVMMMNINARTLKKGISINFKEFMITLFYTGGFIFAFFAISLISVFGLSNIISHFFKVIPHDAVKTSVSLFLSYPGTLIDLPLWSVLSSVIQAQPFSGTSITFIIGGAFSLILANIGAEFITRRSFYEIICLLKKNFPMAWFLALIFGVEIIVMTLVWHDSSITKELSVEGKLISQATLPNTQALGQLIYTDYMYIFHLSGMILLVAMIGAIVLTLRKREGVKRQAISIQVSRRKADTLKVEDVPIGRGI